jgi:ubiquinone/menaquinone biosynthesis C-methylase UbiE
VLSIPSKKYFFNSEGVSGKANNQTNIIMNFFDPKTAAERYSRGRPDFHINTIKHIKDFLHIRNKFDKALDIACGTGLSSKALLEISTNVYGTDASQQMLDFALQTKEIKYSIAPAERQPFADNEFDIVTVCSGIHWFDIDKFLKEANRLLKNKSWLVLYDNYFISEMVGNKEFKKWFPNIYLKKYPSPPRTNDYDWTNENLNRNNFNFIKEETYTNPIIFNKKQLALYFTTQSNILSRVAKGETTFEEVENWLDKELSIFFINEETTRTINYGNWIKFIQRAN